MILRYLKVHKTAKAHQDFSSSVFLLISKVIQIKLFDDFFYLNYHKLCITTIGEDVTMTNKVIANQENFGTSKLDLWTFQFPHLLSFKKSKTLKKHVLQISKNLSNKKRKPVY